jgi:methionine sulfoxide reductase heme-binding subunit
MSEINLDRPTGGHLHPVIKYALYLVGGVVLFITSFITVALLQKADFSGLTNFTTWLFATNTVQSMWYITRSAGLIAYLILWFSVFWGLAVSSKVLDRLLHRSFTFDFHEFISLLAIGFTLVHIGVLLVDQYLPYSVAQILIPFISPYRPVWVGIGVLGFYVTLLVTVTYYLRSKIGMKAFRFIHVFSLLAYLGVTAHSFFSGSDSSLPSVQAMYAVTFFSTVILMAYWLVQSAQKKQAKKAVPAAANTGYGATLPNRFR